MSSGKTPLRTEILLELLGIIVLIAFVGSELSLLRDPGVGWHLRTGEWIALHHQLPSSDPFLFTSAGKSWYCNQWLSDLFFWNINSIGGLASVEVAAILICMLPFLWLLPARLRQVGVSAPTMLLTTLICMGLGLVQWYVRPVIFSFLLFALVYRRLWTRSRLLNWSVEDLILFPVIFALWANLHPGFPLGLGLIAIALFDAALRLGIRSRSALMALGTLIFSGLATALNPYGFALHRAIFGLVSSDYFMGLNIEWQSPNFHNPAFWPLLAAIFLCVTAPKWKDGELLPFEKIAFGLFAALGLTGARYVPFLGVAAATPVAVAIQGYLNLLSPLRRFSPVTAFLDPAERVRFPIGLPTTVVGAALLATTLFTHKIPGWKAEALEVERKFPAEMVQILTAAPQGVRVFHTPNWGGYFTWAVWPRQRAFIDDRNELNGKDIYEDFFAVVKLKKNWRDVIERYHFDFLLLEKDAPVFSVIQGDSHWIVRAQSEGAALFERAAARAPDLR